MFKVSNFLVYFSRRLRRRKLNKAIKKRYGSKGLYSGIGIITKETKEEYEEKVRDRKRMLNDPVLMDTLAKYEKVRRNTVVSYKVK